MIARWLSILSAAWISALAADVKDPSPGGDDFLEAYQIDVFTTQHGLPQNSVLRMAQTPDGFIWVTTWNGLAKFDGVRFTSFTPRNSPGLQSSRVTRVSSDGHGGLWVHSEDGDLCHYANGRFTPLTGEQGAPAEGIQSVGDDAAGRTWFGTREDVGVYRLQNGRLQRIFDKGTLGGIAMEMLLDGEKNLWTLANENFTRLDPPDLLRSQRLPRISGHALDRSGHIVVISDPSMLRLRGDGSWETIAPAGVLTNQTSFFIQDRDGSFWGGTWDGAIWRMDPRGKISIKTASVGFRSILQDKEGSIWLGTDGDGLYRLRPKQIRTLTPRSGFSGNVIKSVTATEDGNVWASSFEGLDLISGETLQRLEKRRSHPHYWVVCADAGDRLWAGSFGGGVGRWTGSQLDSIMFEGKELKSTCLALYVDSKRNVWAGGRFGFLKIRGVEAERFPLPPGNYDYDRNPIRVITEDKSGKLYLGFTGIGLMTLENGQRWTHYRRREGLPDDTISAIYPDSDGTIWLGTIDYGLGRMKGNSFFSFGVSRQWPVQSIYSIIEDDDGYLWVGSNTGLFRVKRKALNDFADGQTSKLEIRKFDTSDGLATTEFAHGEQPTACKTKNGKLWFATVRGVVCVDPKKITLNTQTPPVQIEEVLADDQLEPREADGSVRIAAGHRRVELHFTALSFFAPENVRFRVKMEGVDEDWVDTETQRFVSYNHVPPGHYKFRVIACNNDGVWNETGASMAVVMLPLFWETKFFAVLVIAGICAAGVAVYVRAVRNFKRDKAAQQEFSRRLLEVEESERKRMAAELHDSLGQKLQLIRNRAQLALSRGEPAPSLTEISSITSDAITEVRAITAALRPSELDEVGLRGALEWMIERVARVSGLRILTEMDPIDKLLTPVNEMNLYRIVQETLNNVIKHAGATEVTVEIKKGDGALSVSIFDNGCGFDASANAPRRVGGGGFGLAGIGERVRILGGTHIVDSKVGSGTRLIVTIPLPGA